MQIGTILVTIGIFAAVILLSWRTFTTDRGGAENDAAIVTPPAERSGIA